MDEQSVAIYCLCDYADSTLTHDAGEGPHASSRPYQQPLRKKKTLNAPYLPLSLTCRRGAAKSLKPTGSLVERLLPKGIQAVTSPGFERTLMLVVLACSVAYAV